jgi:4-hydroxy-tetrahydrodipicolinate synthase
VERARPSVVVALLTPFGNDGGLDVGALGEHLEFLLEAGVDGVMPCGTTGEGALLDGDEAAAVIAATVERVDGRAEVLAHVGRPATRAAVRLLRQADEAGADALSAVVPYYYPLDDRAVRDHFRALLAATEKRLFAYNIPARTGNDLSAETAAALATEGLAGVKDSTKSLDRHREYLRAAPPGFAVYMGSDGLVLDAFRAGAAGCVSALANVRPELLVRLAAAVDGGREDEANGLQHEIARLRAETSGPAALKRALAERLDYPSAVRPPLG